jgi:Flp pilus assembly protein TadG
MIKRLWNDRRGVSALAVTVAMVPLLGMVSLGTELGSWYVIRQYAQIAADAAAIAGATALATNDPAGAVTAGQAFARSNGFAIGGAICPPPTSATATTPQNVCITSSGTGAAGTTVTAKVTQYQSPILTEAILQFFRPKGPVVIQATAVATIQNTSGGYCALALQQLTIGGSNTLNGKCGLGSNGTFNPPPAGQNPFQGGPSNWTVVAANGCTGNAQQCNLSGEVQWYSYSARPIPLPTALNDLMNNNVVPAEPTKAISKSCSTVVPSPSTTWQDYTCLAPGTNLQPGLYMFRQLDVNGPGAPVSGAGVNIIIGSGGLGGNGSISMTAGTGNGPPWSDMNGVLIFDQEGLGASKTPDVKFAGNFAGNFNGAIYFPYAHFTFRGGSGGSGLTGCMVVVAKVLDFGGNSSLDTSGCSPSVFPKVSVAMLTN